MRQTGFTREELVALLNNAQSMLPRCLLVNELGVLANEGDTQAEYELHKFLLEDFSERERAAAYCCLSTLEIKSKETTAALLKFAESSANAKICSWASGRGIPVPSAK